MSARAASIPTTRLITGPTTGPAVSSMAIVCSLWGLMDSEP